MAKVGIHGVELARIESDARRYRAMSDGVVLRQVRIDGRWESPTIAIRRADGASAVSWLEARWREDSEYRVSWER